MGIKPEKGLERTEQFQGRIIPALFSCPDKPVIKFKAFGFDLGMIRPIDKKIA